MENLSAEAVRLLADDPCAEVRRQLVSSRALAQHADTDMLLRLAASDPAVAGALAEYLHDLVGCNFERVEAELASHADPSVRLALANHGAVSYCTLAFLSRDADPSVADAALRQTQARRRSCRDGDEGGQSD